MIVSVALEPAVRSKPVHWSVTALNVSADGVMVPSVSWPVGSVSDIVIPVRSALPLFFAVTI